MHITFDKEVDAAYIVLGGKVAPGEVAESVNFIDTPNGLTQVTIDCDAAGRVLGFEVLAASQGLRPEVLEAAEGI